MNNLLQTNNVNYIIASDTDSLYINMEFLVNKFFPNEQDKNRIINAINKICKEKINLVLNQSFKELADYINAYENKMDMKREVICDRALWTGKKYYALSVWDSEGVRFKEPKIKVKGMKGIKSSTPAKARKAFKKVMEVALTQDEAAVQKVVSDFEDEFFTMPPLEMALPSGISDVDKFMNENGDPVLRTPVHCRGAIMYNKALKKFGLEKKYSDIKNGFKIKYLYLKEPNPIESYVISFPDDTIPEELGIEKYIDKQKMYMNAFYKSVDDVMKVVNWETTKVSDGIFC